MSREIYTAMTAASASRRHLEHIANNLANVNTTGYKERRVSFETVLAREGVKGPLAEGYTKLSDGHINQEMGSLLQDDVRTHFAIRGNGFFVVENGNGERFLTRSGNFQIDNQGYLVNQRGEKVQTTTGAVQFDDFQREDFSMSQDGRFIDGRGGEFARLLVMEGENLEPLPGTRWKGENFRELDISNIRVEQGFLEASNVNPFTTMIGMMETTRHLELYQKAMQASKEMDGQLSQMARRSQ